MMADREETKLTVRDKRGSSSGAPDASAAPDVSGAPEEPARTEPGGAPAITEPGGAPARDYLDDLRRLQAEFDNYRKRMLREQTSLAQRASARLVERLLPVMDNFEAALSHGEGGSGIELVHKELTRILKEEGLVEIEALDVPFDPRVHEAFEVTEREGIEIPVSSKVLRRGYVMNDQVLRPAMVSVTRPAERNAVAPSKDDEQELDQEVEG